MGKERNFSDSILEWLQAISNHSGKIEVNDESLFEALAKDGSEETKEDDSHYSIWNTKLLKWIDANLRFIRPTVKWLGNIFYFVCHLFKWLASTLLKWLFSLVRRAIAAAAKLIGSNRIYRRLNNSLFHKRSFRFIMIVATLFFVLVFTVHFSVVFIKDVILFNTELNVNEQGALNPRKALNCEHAVYLFNPSEVWANTGVRLNKGDKYRINISGGAHTSMYDAIRVAKENIKPDEDYGWDRCDTIPFERKEPGIMFCLSKGSSHLGSDGKIHKYSFGTIIHTVQSEGSNVVYNPLSVPVQDMRSWDPGNRRKRHDGDRDFHEAISSGYLYLAVNDIVFGDIRDGDILRLKYENGAYLRILYWSFKEFPESEATKRIKKSLDSCDRTYLHPQASENIKNYIYSDLDYFIKKEKHWADLRHTIVRPKETIKAKLDSILNIDHKYFYKDNVGQVLVSIEIQRGEPWAFFNPMIAYRDFETRVAELPEADVNAC